MPPDILVFDSIITVIFDYCSIVWGNWCKSLCDKLQKLQNRAARIQTFLNYDINADKLFKELGWRKLNIQRQLQKALMFYKSLNNLTTGYLRSQFTYRRDISKYNLRDSLNKLAIPKQRTDYLKNSFNYSGAVLWNSLPSDLRKAESLNIFRNNLLCSSLFTD